MAYCVRKCTYAYGEREEEGGGLHASRVEALLTIYRLSFRILAALRKNDVARYVGGQPGRPAYNRELSLRLSLSL